MSREDAVQSFLDATQNPGVFCEGRILSYTIPEGPITRKPNCGATEDCPLFRRPEFGVLLRPWQPIMERSPEEGCWPYQLLEDWRKAHQRWIVTFEGHAPREVCGRDVLSAACAAWWNAAVDGEPISKWLLFGRRYTVREA